MNMYRQGDVLLIEVEPVEGGDAVKRVDHTFTTYVEDGAHLVPIYETRKALILAYGKITGHAHAILDKSVKLVEWDGARYVSSDQPFTITHEEHASVAVPAGTFKVIHQREYTPQEIRRVMD